MQCANPVAHCGSALFFGHEIVNGLTLQNHLVAGFFDGFAGFHFGATGCRLLDQLAVLNGIIQHRFETIEPRVGVRFLSEALYGSILFDGPG